MHINKEIMEMIKDLEDDNLDSLEIKMLCYDKNRRKNKPIVTKDFLGINGLWYIENYLTKEELIQIKTALQSNVKLQPLGNAYSRKVAHYGYYYSYDRSGLREADEIPVDFSKLVDADRINKLVEEFLITKPFEQLIINEYKPGQQIGYHTDHISQFGPIIICLTVGQSVPIKFKFNSDVKILQIAEGSAYIMTGDSRYKWKHSLKNNSRENRYSLTYRTINN